MRNRKNIGKYLWLNIKNMYILSLYSAKSSGSFKLLTVVYNGHKSPMKSVLEQQSNEKVLRLQEFILNYIWGKTSGKETWYSIRTQNSVFKTNTVIDHVGIQKYVICDLNANHLVLQHLAYVSSGGTTVQDTQIFNYLVCWLQDYIFTWGVKR